MLYKSGAGGPRPEANNQRVSIRPPYSTPYGLGPSNVAQYSREPSLALAWSLKLRWVQFVAQAETQTLTHGDLAGLMGWKAYQIRKDYHSASSGARGRRRK